MAYDDWRDDPRYSQLERTGDPLRDDFTFAVWIALSGIGTRHGGKRNPGSLRSDLAKTASFRAIDLLIDRGWQFRHRSWPTERVIGKAGDG